MRHLTIFAALLAFAGCASSPDDINAIPYPDTAYEEMDCLELANEHIRVSEEVLELTGRQRDKNQVLAVTGRILFAPVLFIMEDTDDNAERLAQLKGRFEAVQRVTSTKQCSGV
jgi:hypothetical protein